MTQTITLKTLDQKQYVFDGDFNTVEDLMVRIENDLNHPKDCQQLIYAGKILNSVDNIPGVPGIGPKTASKLLKVYGSMENLLDNVEDLKGKQKENLINFAEQGKLSKLLATIKLDIPIEFNEQKLLVEEINKPALKKVFQELEFRSLARQILGEERQAGEQQSLFGASASLAPSAPTETPYKVAAKNIETVDHVHCCKAMTTFRKGPVEVPTQAREATHTL